MEHTISFDNAGYHYGIHWAVRRISARLPLGITALLGANGAGKTTLMRLAMGLLSPHEGSVFLMGKEPAKYPAFRLKVGYLPQSFEPPRWMRVYDFVENLVLMAGVKSRDARVSAVRAIELVGLSSAMHKPLGGLSGGMLRRVGIAQALAHQPELLILDEPAAGLDPEERIRLYRLLRSLADDRPVLVSTHLVDEIEREADQVWMMRRGQLVWSGTIQEALKSMVGRVREGVLPDGSRPSGHHVSKRPTTTGNLSRVIGEDTDLPLCEPTLLDAYIYYAGQGDQ